MKTIFYSLIILLLGTQQLFSQELREEIILKGNVYKIYDINSEDQKLKITKYQIKDNSNNVIEHIARKFDKSKSKDIFLGIYRKNDDEIHFIEFNQTIEPNTLDHFVYAPNNKGRLQLIKKEIGLKDYPTDLPAKFKDNKPIHPEFIGGNSKLNEWIDENIIPSLKSKLKNEDLNLVLEIDVDGNATIANLSALRMSRDLEIELITKIKKMPKWNTTIQGYKLTGTVMIPLSLQ